SRHVPLRRGPEARPAVGPRSDVHQRLVLPISARRCECSAAGVRVRRHDRLSAGGARRAGGLRGPRGLPRRRLPAGTRGGRGRRVALSPLVVQIVVDERDFSTLVSHELRWARTIRSLRPVGYLFSCITFGFPLSLLALACGGPTPVTLAALAANLVARVIGWHA